MTFYEGTSAELGEVQAFLSHMHLAFTIASEKRCFTLYDHSNKKIELWLEYPRFPTWENWLSLHSEEMRGEGRGMKELSLADNGREKNEWELRFEGLEG